jgi:hypothetical protein
LIAFEPENISRKRRKMIRYKPTKTLVPLTPTDLESTDFHWELDPTVITWDGGNGTSSAWHLVGGELHCFLLPNVRVPVTGYAMNSEVTTIGLNEMVYADVAAGRFAIGDNVWEQSQYPPETFINSPERYGSEIHIFMLLCLLAALNAPEDTPLTIVTSAPPGLVNSVAKTIKQNLRYGEAKDKSGTWTIQMSYDKKPRKFIIGKVIVVPEGVGAFSAYAYDANGNDVLIPSLDGRDDLLTGQVHIHDAGYGTYDTYVVRNGKLDAESMAFATDRDAGVLRQVIEPVMDYIRDQFAKAGDTAPKLKPIQVDSWLREWSLGKMKAQHARVKLHGRILDLQAIFELVSMRYARFITEEKLERSFQQGADSILLAGGGWVYMLPHVLKQYPNKNILHPGIVPHLKGIPLWELNAYGALPMSAANIKVSRKVSE